MAKILPDVNDYGSTAGVICTFIRWKINRHFDASFRRTIFVLSSISGLHMACLQLQRLTGFRRSPEFLVFIPMRFTPFNPNFRFTFHFHSSSSHFEFCRRELLPVSAVP